MPFESATYVQDLQPANPPDTDPRAQGAEHIRLIKQVLQNTFGNATRQWQVPGIRALSAGYSVLKSDGESILYVSTAGGSVTLTLPTLVALDAGWKTTIVKTSSDVNPIFIAPPSGTINSGGNAGLARARRCIPAVPVQAVWDGANWFVTRATSLPIGSMIDFSGSALPAGFEWPSGQTLSSAANYPEYNAVMGGLLTIDMRGRVAVTMDNLGGTAAGRLPSGFINGSVLGNAGGVDAITLVTANLPPYTPAGAIANGAITTTLSSPADFVGGGGAYCPGGGTYGNPATITALGATATSTQAASTFTGTAQGGTSTPASNLQPSIMCNKILVVE